MEQHKYCLITGASRGIGRDLAREFAHNGHALVLVARDKVALTVLRDELHAYTPDIRLFAVDLSVPQNCINLVEELKQSHLHIDILVNNAGLGLRENFSSMNPEIIHQMISVNVMALTLLTRLLLPEMLHRKQGRILNLSSTAAFQPGPKMAVYYASKAYVLSFTQALAEETRAEGVTVTALCPGPTNTDFIHSAKTDSSRIAGLLGFMPSSTVAKAAYKGTMQGKRIVIPGISNKILACIVKISPTILTLKVLKYLHNNQ